jgi:hypothetical protein
MARTAVRGRLTWRAVTVASVTRETASVVTIELDPPHWPDHRAGQHLDVQLTAEDGHTAERGDNSAPGIRDQSYLYGVLDLVRRLRLTS